MGITKQCISVFFICAIFNANVSYAGFPTLDFATLPQGVSQLKTIKDELDNTRETMKRISSQTKAMGASVLSFGNFFDDLIAIGNTYSGMISQTAGFINDNTGANININKKIEGALVSISNGYDDTMSDFGDEIGKSLSFTDYIDTGADYIGKADNYIGVAEGFNNLGSDITNDISNSGDKSLWDQIKDASGNINDYTEDVNYALDNLSETGVVDQGVINDIRNPINDANDTQRDIVNASNSAKEGYKDGLGEDGDSAGIWDNVKGAANSVVEAAKGARNAAGSAGISDSDLNEALNGLEKSGGVMKDAADLGQDGKEAYDKYKSKKDDKKDGEKDSEVVEEEEEEEEISEEESIGQELKEAIKKAQENSDKIYIRFNDMLDMQINTLNTNATENDNSFDKLINNLYGAKKIKEDAKEDFRERLIELKKKHRNIADRNIILMEALKLNYAKEYKEKVSDNIHNYDRMIDMYVRGDVSKDDIIKKGEEIKKVVSTFSVTIDKVAQQEIENDIKQAKEELNALVSDIKKAEEGNKTKID